MRPVDLNAAMRADLVCILKDVVGLIARIEARIPYSPEESHERTSRTTGECPEASPVDETPSVAGAGAEGPQGTVATISNQPTDTALPPSVEMAAPPAVEFAPLPQEAPKPVLIPKAQAKPKSKPLDPRPGKLVGVVIDAPGTVLALDMKQLVAVGPKGDWDIGTRPVALIMERMRNGETFGDDVLAELGSMGTDTFRESRKRWADELAKVGVTFIHTKGVGCRIEVAK